MNKAGKILAISMAVCGIFVVKSAQAQTLDLTTLGASGFIGNGLYQQTDAQPTGSGVIQSFVQITGNDDVKDAYNTTVNNVLDNGSSDVFNHEVLLSSLATIPHNNTNYYRFLLDINQNNANRQNPQGPLLSLDEVQIFQSSIANQSVDTFSGGVLNLAGSDLVYRMDNGADNWVKLDASLNNGSGSGDMYLLIPEQDFKYSGQYVYLYSKFGINNANNGGFEEWAALKGDGTSTPNPVVPEPASLITLGGGLLAAAARFRKKFQA